MPSEIECESCKSAVIPRLWHEDSDNIIFKRNTEHICPICGQTMYHSGGGLIFIGRLCALLLFWWAFGYALIAFFGLGSYTSLVITSIVTSGIAIKWFIGSNFGRFIFGLVGEKGRK